MILRGRVWKVGDGLTAGGDIVPTEYDYLGVNLKWSELAQHLFEKVVPEFAANVRKGDLVVAGKSFGAGHAHFLVQAVQALVVGGVGGCIAKSYAGAFQRRALNGGFPAIEAQDVYALVETGDEIELNLRAGRVRNLTRDRVITVQSMPQMIIDILESGGLEAYAVRRLKTPT